MPINLIEETGGAQIGMARASWPFAKLKVTKDKLELNAGFIGLFVFAPTDIISIEPYSSFFNRGIKINHCVGGYNKTIAFFSLGAGSLIESIRQTGFLDNNDAVPSVREMADVQATGGFPFKWPPVIGLIVIWNILFLINGYGFFNGHRASPIGVWARVALAFVFLTGLCLLLFKPMQHFMLKKGRTINDVKLSIYFIMFITGIMLLATLTISF
jgi:hypothetical protein